MNDVRERIQDVFTQAGVRGRLHARRVGHAESVEVDADDGVVLASVFKIVVAVAFARAVDEGALDPKERVIVRQRAGRAQSERTRAGTMWR
ncbi:serine hydrolase [Microbacterium sp. NIBRBAC000506063]|uniref:serine hydrolase n=1 Tax=Microbacterium sp. NIBRBAC000506063 TaxID=2734618 RepID=UPI001BB5EF87|nr:serine hydrolase [Microbacterium sp. NIBRBAC000506063]